MPIAMACTDTATQAHPVIVSPNPAHSKRRRSPCSPCSEPCCCLINPHRPIVRSGTSEPSASLHTHRYGPGLRPSWPRLRSSLSIEQPADASMVLHKTHHDFDDADCLWSISLSTSARRSKRFETRTLGTIGERTVDRNHSHAVS
jgi:hypothetical protein